MDKTAMEKSDPAPLPRTQSRKSKRQRQYFVALFCVLLLAVAAILLYFKFFHISKSATDNIANKVQGVTLTSGDASRCYPFGDRLVMVYDDHVILTDIKRQRLASSELKLTQPIVRIIKNRFLIYDAAGSRLVVFDYNGVVTEAQFEGVIDGVDYDGNETLAVLLRKPTDISVLECRPFMGTAKFELEFAVGKKPTDVRFSSDGAAIDTIIYDLDASYLTAKIRRIDLAGKIITETADFEPATLMPLLLPQSKNALPLYYGAEAYGLIEAKKSVPSATPSPVLTNAVSLGQGAAFSVKDQQTGDFSLMIIDATGKLERKLKLPFMPKAISAQDDVVAVLGNNQICFYQRNSEAIGAVQTLPQKSVRMAFRSDGSLDVVTVTGIIQVLRGK